MSRARLKRVPHPRQHLTFAQSGRRCTKICFDTEAEAVAKLEKIRARRRAGETDLNADRVQFCWQCDKHHLTSTRTKKL